MKYLKQVTYIFLIIGGLNWGIYGIAKYDVIDVLFGNLPMIANIIYVLVGLSAVYVILNKYVLCDCSNCCSGCHSDCRSDCHSGCCSDKEEKDNSESNENLTV